MRDADGAALRSTLLDMFAGPFDEPAPDDVFNGVALRVFEYQFQRNTPYAAFCERRGLTPATVGHWSRIPAVPTAAFKEVALVSGDPAAAEAVFRTSGTTHGAERRGAHYVLDTSLYHASLLSSFAACLLPDGAELRMISLVPPAHEMPDSSLAHMIRIVIERLGSSGSRYCADIDRGIDVEQLAQALRVAEADGEPVGLLGTSFACVRWMDELVRTGERFRLPVGSRLMDTGGYKGHGRQVDEATLRDMYGKLLGLRPEACVNEYGMTEMLSQFYDASLRDAVTGRSGEPRKLVPPWVRTRIVDPETLEPVPVGTQGLLQHYDAANVGSVMAI
ncbi:MAG TPA: hypothetical protein VHG09_09590, partial [Longimicrobiales bacterium]|nr:hypothetical protein [Longimicrobiales bacterium]